MVSLFFILVVSNGQVRISGKVTDVHGEPILGANVLLKDTYDGASSQADGTYEFETTATGDQVLISKFIGYKDFVASLVITSQAVTVDVRMEETINELKAVTISAGAFTASDATRRTVLKAIDIASTAGATADIAGALNTLPGTQKVGETGRLFVRGGDSNEARTFIDGLVVLDAYSTAAPNTPSRGRFLPFMFKGTSFSTGGYSAEYGQALSSALVLDSKDEAASTRTDIGILSVGGDIGHTQAWDRGSVGGKIQYTNIRPYFGLINQEIDWQRPPESLEAVTAFRQQVGKAGMVKFYGNLNHSNFSLYNHSIDQPQDKQLYELTNNYGYLNGFYRMPLNNSWTLRGGLSYTSIRENITIEGLVVNALEQGTHVKTVLEGSLSDNVELKTGVEILQRNYDQYLDNPDVAASLGFDEVITSAFAEADLYATNDFVTRLGARTEYNSLTNRVAVDPRISVAYKAGSRGQISFAYGQYRQSVKNELLRIDPSLTAEKASHYILNYQWLENNRTFRVETYYKQYHDLAKNVSGNPAALDNGGNGYARGVDIFWRDNQSVKNGDYWFSYSFLDTERDYLNYPSRAIPSFASAHNLSFVYKQFIPSLKSQIGLTYSYASGRTYNDPNMEAFNAGKTPYYSDLSMNFSYLPKPYIILHFSCTNLLGRDNIFGYEFGEIPDVSGVYPHRAIRQAAPRFLFIGIFITLSKDKTTNQLPSL